MKFFRYFKECWLELRKVSWPSRQVAIRSTWIVILVTLGSAILLGVCDILLGFLMRWVF